MLGHLLRNGIKEASDAPLTSTRPRAFLELLWIELPCTLVATPSAAQLLKLQAPASLLRCFSRFIWRVLESGSLAAPAAPRATHCLHRPRDPFCHWLAENLRRGRAARMRRMAAASYCIFMWDLI